MVLHHFKILDTLKSLKCNLKVQFALKKSQDTRKDLLGLIFIGFIISLFDRTSYYRYYLLE